MHTSLEYRIACPSDAAECIELRGHTRQNPISVSQLAQLGITAESLSKAIGRREQIGFLCLFYDRVVGYCFGHRESGEIVVLALLPDFENKGVGKGLLGLVVEELRRSGRTTLFLGCSTNPEHRSYGFYRHLGWRTANRYDCNGDEILQYHVHANSEA